MNGYVSSPKESRVFFSFLAFLAELLVDSLPPFLVFSETISSSWLVAFRLFDLKLALDEDAKESPWEADLEVDDFASLASLSLLSSTSATTLAGSGRGGKPFSQGAK